MSLKKRGIMEIRNDGCTFCTYEPDGHLSQPWTAIQAYDAFGLKHLIFYPNCQELVKKYTEYIEQINKDLSKYNEPICEEKHKKIMKE